MLKKIFFILFGLALSSANAAGPQHKTITAEELKQMLDGKGKMVLVDARSEQEFRQGHLPKAVSLPSEKVSAAGALLPKDKSAPVVIYCRGYS